MRRLPALVVSCLVLAVVGCSSAPEPSSGLLVRLAPELSSAQLLCTPQIQPTSLTSAQADVLRLTILREDVSAEGGARFVCDRLVALGESNTSIYAPLPEGVSARVIAEAWKLGGGSTSDGGTTGSGAATLVASGQLRGVDLRSVTEERAVILADARSFSCPLGTAQWPRAFHTATLLPDGRVALVGGLTPSKTGDDRVNPQEIYATAKVEVYDPDTQTFVMATDNSTTSATPRAFHSAYLLESEPDQAKILLVGGLTSEDGSEGTPVAELDGRNLLDIVPRAGAKAADAELLVLDLPSLTYSRTVPVPAPLPRFMAASTEDPPAPLSSNFATVFGGATDGLGPDSLPTPQMTYELLQTKDDGAPAFSDAPLMAAGGRLGATVTDVGTAASTASWLVLGGNLWAADEAELASSMAESVTAAISSDLPTSASSSIQSYAGLPPTAFHTATPIRNADDGSLAILVAGGFLIHPSAIVAGQMAALDPADETAGLPRLSVITGPTVSPVELPAPLRGVGYHDAIRLRDGSVLVTGGSAYNTKTPGMPNECPWNYECPSRTCTQGTIQQSSLQCAVCQAFRYFHATDATSRRVEVQEDLLVPRFGHRSTLLWDGTVLVTGGITSRLDKGCEGNEILMMLTSAELYNPQGSGDDPLVALGVTARLPGEGSDDPCCTCPSSIDEAKTLASECAGATRECSW